jgi:hypothetical protein
MIVLISKWHRKNAVFAQGPTTLPVASYTTALPEQVAGATWDGGPSSIGVRLELLHLAGRKTVVFLRHYTLETEHLFQDRLGITIGKTQKRTFSRCVHLPETRPTLVSSAGTQVKVGKLHPRSHLA